ncbi:MAG: hypothetical protein A2Y57_02100 [Candidatus Woykebacteria bacterium RBG_13_40_7b]|uniref:Uncharacterized protein n=1 Tax=Candidatus Woykebacteria bacterium RBG_13_40_7b TaxID=1802594 RepID=A0A1G1W9S6_9BACT|nr:MAG: hypothetical protein A2Y57_02100 [Candidatus Woykebacteria bacterium RBG_13_40_7b]
MVTALMQYLKQPVDIKSSKTMATLIGTFFVLLVLPLTVFTSLQQRESTNKTNFAAEASGALPTLNFGTFANTGTTGFRQQPQSNILSLSYNAGYVLRQEWSTIETSDDSFNWSYLDGAIDTLKNAGKKAMIRISAGPYSPDWLRTQKNIPTGC